MFHQIWIWIVSQISRFEGFGMACNIHNDNKSFSSWNNERFVRKSKEQKLVHVEPAPLRPDSIRNRRRLFVFESVRNFFLLAAAILPRARFQGKRDNPKCFDSFGSCYNHLQQNYSRLGNLVTNVMAQSKHWQSLPVDLVFICKECEIDHPEMYYETHYL